MVQLIAHVRIILLQGLFQKVALSKIDLDFTITKHYNYPK